MSFDTVTCSQVRGGVTIASSRCRVHPYDASQIGNLGVNPGFRMQDWRLFLFDAPAPDWQVDDDVVFGADSYNVAMANAWDLTTQVMAWKFNYNLTIKVSDNAGNVLVASWPAIIEPAISPSTASGTTTLQTSVDAMLYCPVNDLITQGKRVTVTQRRGVTVPGGAARSYGIKSRNDEFLFGKIIECELEKKV